MRKFKVQYLEIKETEFLLCRFGNPDYKNNNVINRHGFINNSFLDFSCTCAIKYPFMKNFKVLDQPEVSYRF